MSDWYRLIAEAEARGWLAGLEHRDRCTAQDCVCRRGREEIVPQQPDRIDPEDQTLEESVKPNYDSPRRKPWAAFSR